ncbi:MAG: hypothetical protein ACYCTB_03260 [bacterium]
MKTINIIKSIIYPANTGNNQQRTLLIAGVSSVVFIFLIFSIIIPEINGTKLTNTIVKNQKSILSYILKYSDKINRLKLTDKAKIKSPASAGAARRSAKVIKKGYIKFISSLIKYFKINKDRVSKLYSRYSSKKGAAGKESVFLSLKGLSLNQCVNMIYALSSSYNAKIVSIKVKKNFKNDKLLNLSLNIERHHNAKQ